MAGVDEFSVSISGDTCILFVLCGILCQSTDDASESKKTDELHQPTIAARRVGDVPGVDVLSFPRSLLV